MTSLLKMLKNTADNIAAAMLAAMFVTFLLQIACRYLFDLSLSWTVEVCLSLWLWLIFWVAAFCARETDHIRFDMLYLSVNKKVRRVFSIVTALVIICVFLYSLEPTLDYLWFYKIKKSPVLRIPLHYVFSIYGVFILAIVARYLWKLWGLIHPGLNKQREEREEI
ncbi:MAG: C4-dicarboxylate ABC transporter permease [Desulfuromonas sp.]|nr:MAG: C4-dicarboxylate ABC transporter permease [Desulfuromonas sp.]